MEIEEIRIADLHEDPANVRRHPERNLATIKASLARFGQQKPIVIDAGNVVRAGNGTLAAARALGWEAIRCVRTELKGVEATAYAISDNQSALQAEWNDDALAETLRALQDEHFDLDAVGFTADEIDAMFTESPISPADDATPPGDFAAYDEAIETEYRCPKCNYEWSGKPK